MSLRTIFDVCARETGYKGGEETPVPWWRQKAEENHMKVMVEEILAAERVHRQKESERHGRSEGGPEGGTTDSKE